jgi:hypothetical protein
MRPGSGWALRILVGYKGHMRPLFLLAASLFLVACDDPIAPPVKTDVDLASDCLAQLAECSDWTPVPAPPGPPQICDEECSEYGRECQDRRTECREANRAEATKPPLKSPCQVKAELCIRLVEATKAEKEIHHHSSYGK